MSNDLCVVIQGPSNHVDILREAWEGFDIIWSTWKGEENKYETNDMVIFNDYPSIVGVSNIGLQQKSSINGSKLAKELNYKRILKWRSDMIPNNPNLLIDSFDKESINFLAWHSTGEYFIDYFIESSTEDMIKIWDFETPKNKFPERIITDNIINQGFKKFNYCLKNLSIENEIFWLKPNIKLSEYKNHLVYNRNLHL